MFVVVPTAVEPTNPSFAYAVASIRRHTDYDIVTIGHNVGHEPHIPTKQLKGNIFTNTDLAMQAACNTPWIGPEFIWSADDIYWLKPAEPIRWAIGKLEDAHGSTVYAQRKRHTAAWLNARGLPTFDYESHTPLLIQPGAMLDVLAYIDREPMLDKRSLYGNLTGEPDIIAADVKVRSRRDPIPDAPWASTDGRPTTWPALMERL